MSGGHFDYKQREIDYIIEELEQIILNNGRLKTENELKNEYWNDAEYYKKYPEALYHRKYPDDIIDEFKKGLQYLKLASIYTKRIDWLICDDDGEDSFRIRLKNELNELNELKKIN